MKVGSQHYRTVWAERPEVLLIDQRLLPFRFEVLRLAAVRETAEAIRDMAVRGAGAIGATAGFALAQAAEAAPDEWEAFRAAVDAARDLIEATRPTAQNLFYATREVYRAIVAEAPNAARARDAAWARAQQIADDDSEACRHIGRVGAEIIPSGARVLTHCNAGWLAFVDWGSALAPIYEAARRQRRPFVYVDETRPRGQGARLTAWELAAEGIDHRVVADNAAAHLMSRGAVDLVIVGADRIAANGDVANKIGTLAKALAAEAFDIPFYVAAPLTTIDPACPKGADIPIEERAADEVRYVWGRDDEGGHRRVQITLSPALNPAFDVTPARLIKGIITPKGIVEPSPEGLAPLL